MRLRLLLTGLFAIVLSGCATQSMQVPAPSFVGMSVPEGISGRIPRLSPLNDGLLMSWVEKTKKHARLRFARFRQGSWSSASTVAEGDDWLVNYADYANVTALDDDRFVASWLVLGAGKRCLNYHFMVSQSFDSGKHWSEPTTPIRFGQPGEHGFVTVQSVGDDVLLAWISEDSAIDGNYMLRSALLTRDGRWLDNQVVDDMTCSCCHPDMTTGNGRILLAYRDRTAQEIRDMALAQYQNGQWSTPDILHHDDWKINGCPVQGPAIEAAGDAHVAIWFTAAHDRPAVNMVAKLSTGNRLFKQLQGEAASGFVDTTRLSGQRVAMLWLAQATRQPQTLNVQAIDLKTGRLSARAIRKMAHRVIGFPSMQSFEQSIVIAYESSNKTIRLLRLNNL